MEEQEDSVNEEDLQRFRELKDKMILLDRAELDHSQLTAQSDGKPNSYLLPNVR
ncbi:hypothetical protein LDENG_00299600, partial [Lucifuga dentata]